MSEIGDLLRELRGKKSLRKVAEETGLSHSYIRDIELGYKHNTKAPTTPSPDTLRRLAEAYNYPYKDLLIKAGFLEEEESDENKDFEAFRNRPDLEVWYKELPKSSEEELEMLKEMFEFWRNRNKKDGK